MILLAAATLFLGTASAASAAEQTSWKLDFGGGTAPGFQSARPDAAYKNEAGFGFDGGAELKSITRGGADKLRDGFVTSDKPFLFSVAVPEGVYRVTVTLGDPQDTSVTTVKAEARRLMLEKVETAKGRVETRTFLVAVKRPELRTGGTVTLKPVELDGHRDWDDKLTFEFSNARPCLCALEIAPAQNFTTIYIAGDSTVTNQRSEPWGGWGQMLPRFFNDSVAVANHAHSGLALFSFERQKRLEKVLSTMNTGDYLFIQFGHNDQKDKSPGAGPFTTYKANLKRFVEVTRSKGGIPVLVTPMERRRFDENGRQGATLSDFAEATRQAGSENDVPVIDLNAMSLKLYAALGPDKSKIAFAHYPVNTFPGQTKPLKDDTHHSVYGAYELARCVVDGIKANVPELAARLVKDSGAFDPAKPDSIEQVKIPASPANADADEPEGN
jgi:lysophospholipase L1-like esterase